jgi:ribosomal protein S9
MPTGAVNEVGVRVARVVPYLTMKGILLHSRLKEKDAYDIYFTVKHYGGGTEELAKALRPHISNRLVLEGLSKIRAKFKDVDSLGPVNVAEFMEVSDPDERERIIRDAFERVAGLLDELRIDSFAE